MLPDLRIWLNHFEYHAEQPRSVPADSSDVLTLEERALVARPLHSFLSHQGPASDALLRAAYGFSQQRAAPEVARILELLVRESAQHERLIMAFMSRHRMSVRSERPGVPGATHASTGAALEGLLSQRLTWQMCNVVCYRATERVTGNQQLRLLCRMLVAEQLAHIGFTADLLLALRAEHPPWARHAGSMRERGWGLVTVVRMWRSHRAVLSRAGYGLREFLQAARSQYIFYMQPLPPRVGARQRGLR